MNQAQRPGIWMRSDVVRFVNVLSIVALVAGIGAISTALFPRLSIWLDALLWGLFLAALFGLLVLFIRLRAAAKDAREAAYDFNSELYGYAYESLKVTGLIHNDGSIGFRRDMIARAYTKEIGSVDHWMLAPEAPEDSTIELGDPHAAQPAFVEVRKRVVRQTSERVAAVLHIEPAIKLGEQLQFTMSETLPSGSMALTYEELDSRGMLYEFVAWDITRPTRQFNLSIIFPDDLVPVEIEHDVWYGVSRMPNPHESARIEPNWSEVESKGEREYSLQIPYPVLGLTYVIKWVPPDSIEAEI